MVGELQTLPALKSWTVDNCGNSVPTDLPVSAYLSSSTVYPGVHTFLPFLGVRPMRYHGVPGSVVVVVDLLQGRNLSLYTKLVHPVL